jgi:hypothetical protein
VAHHDVVLILLFPLAVAEIVFTNQLNHCRQLGQCLLVSLCLRWRRELCRGPRSLGRQLQQQKRPSSARSHKEVKHLIII